MTGTGLAGDTTRGACNLTIVNIPEGFGFWSNTADPFGGAGLTALRATRPRALDSGARQPTNRQPTNQKTSKAANQQTNKPTKQQTKSTPNNNSA